MSDPQDPPPLVLSSRILTSGHMALKLCRHGPMLYNVNDSYIGRSLDSYGEWCEGEMDLLGSILRPGDVVLDIGANIGTHTVFFAKAVGPEGMVYAFEPQPFIFQNLCANVALNALTNVFIFQQAVGDSPGMVRVPVLHPEKELNFGSLRLKDQENGLGIPVIPVDRLQLERCDLIKVDVEGMEAEVLDGARETIERCRPILFVENNREENSARLIEKVFSMGYLAYWHFVSYFNPDNFFGQSQNIFPNHVEGNMFCVEEELENLPEHLKVTGLDDTWLKAWEREKQATASEQTGE